MSETRGDDPRECVLVAYGGAGPTHAVFYGRDIGARAILVPADSAVFSAEGMLTCDVTHTLEVSRLLDTPFSEDDLARVTERFAELEERILRQFESEGAGPKEVSLSRTLGVRFRQQIHTVEVGVDSGPPERPALAEAAGRLRGLGVEIHLDASGEALAAGAGTLVKSPGVPRPAPAVGFPAQETEGVDASHAARGERRAYFEPLGFIDAAVYTGGALRAGNVVGGPAIIERMGDSVVVPPGYEACVDRYLSLRLSAVGESPGLGMRSGSAPLRRLRRHLPPRGGEGMP